MNDNVRPERSQSFTYDPVSRLTSAENLDAGGYGTISYNYNLVGDRTARNYIATNAARIDALGALIIDKESRIDANTLRITELEVLILDKQSRIAALNPNIRADRIAELEALIVGHQDRIAFLSTRNTELADLIIGHEERSAFLTSRNTELAALKADLAT